MPDAVQPCPIQTQTLPGRLLPGGVILAAALGLASPATAQESGIAATLRWRSGDELRGELLAGDPGRIRFAASPFAKPFELTTGQLGGLRFGARKDAPEAPGGTLFDLTLINGDRLRGRLVAIGAETLTFASAPFREPVEIQRESVARVARIRGSETGLSGLGEPGDWTSSGRDRKPTDWFTDLRGELATHQWSGNLFREIALPERVEVRFRARFPLGSPNLEVGLLREPQRGPMLETWDNMLVLTDRTRFAPVFAMDEKTREVDLRLFWNQSSGEVILCEPSGKPLASLVGVTPGPPAEENRSTDPLRRGFSILSRNPEMRLLSLEVREWDGDPVPLVDLARPRVQLDDETVRFQLDDLSLATGSEQLLIGGETRALADLVELVLNPVEDETAIAASASATRVAWHSGSSLSGEFLRLAGGLVEIQPPWSIAPVSASLAGSREIRFPENAEPLAPGTDTLAIGPSILRGTVRLSPEAGGTLLAWEPPGAVAAVPLSPDARVTIRRSPFPDADAEPPVTLSQARIYLDNDEILTGELVSIDESGVVFESRITGPLRVPAGRVRAIDIGTAGRLLEGFRDSEWEEVEEHEDEVRVTPEKATLRGGSFGNPSLLLGDRIRFEAEWKESYGAMTLRLFASGAETGNPSTDVIIAAQGNRLFIGKLNESGAFSFSGDQIPIANNRATIDVSARPEEIEIRINGKSSLVVKVEPDQISGNGIYFKMGGGWQGWNQAESTIEISRFRIESSPGSVPRRVIDPRAKSQVLAIPRTLREQVPTHLLIAPNGDLLRGRLVSAGRDQIDFYANGQNLQIPRSRVSGIVRLGAPEPLKTDENVADEDDDTPGDAPIDPFAKEHHDSLQAFNFRISHQVVLRDGSRLRLDGQSIEENRLVGVSAVLGRCRISLENLREVHRFPPVPAHKAKAMDLVAFHDWQAVFTPDPVIPQAGGGPVSPLVGKEAPDFEISMLDDSVFKLSQHRGKVVVLDFWATWCGPCIKAMPDVVAVVNAFPEGFVTFCAVNQGETPPLVTGFLEARKWQDTPVALDFNLKVGRAYEAEAIPHTVVIDPEGKIAWVHSGYAPDLKEKLFEAIATVLSR